MRAYIHAYIHTYLHTCMHGLSPFLIDYLSIIDYIDVLYLVCTLFVYDIDYSDAASRQRLSLRMKIHYVVHQVAALSRPRLQGGTVRLWSSSWSCIYPSLTSSAYLPLCWPSEPSDPRQHRRQVSYRCKFTNFDRCLIARKQTDFESIRHVYTKTALTSNVIGFWNQ